MCRKAAHRKMTDRLSYMPPQDREAEKATLGSMLLSKRAIQIARAIVTSSDYYYDHNKIISEAINGLYDRKSQVDIITLQGELENRKQYKKIGGMGYLSNLLESTPSALGIETYARSVKDKSILRQLIKTADEIISSAYNNDDAAQVTSTAREKIIALTKEFIGEEGQDIKQICSDFYKELQASYDSGSELTGLPTGFEIVDKYLCGLRELLIIGGRPAMGKSSLAVQIGDHNVQMGKRVLLFSVEMPRIQIIRKIVSQRTKIDGRKLLVAKDLTEYEWAKISQTTEEISNSGWVINDKSSQMIEEIEARIYAEHEKAVLDLVIVDYVQIIRILGGEKRYRGIGRCAETLYLLSKTLNVPVILVSQLSRATEESATRRPRLSDLRESGDLEQHASSVLFVHRPRLQGAMKYEKEYTELLLRKNRHGRTGTVRAEMNCPATYFEEGYNHNDEE